MSNFNEKQLNLMNLAKEINSTIEKLTDDILEKWMELHNEPMDGDMTEHLSNYFLLNLNMRMGNE